MKAVQIRPQSGLSLGTLGTAQYRAGDWEAAIESLERSVKLKTGRSVSHTGFFLAMAHWQLGHQEEAHRQYEKSVEWLEKNKAALEKNRAAGEELERFRAEAAELLGIKPDNPTLQETSPPPAGKGGAPSQ
jgi:uncharacterized protein HemY